ncbi:MAG: VOC family protein [Pelosinus sp.]|nr:VOC family protein [Pelosinus sp.]
MKIEHIAIYTNRLEEMKEFYTYYFNGTANDKYVNSTKGFESYFIAFESGARLELMCQRDTAERNAAVSTGFVHLAFSVKSKEKVDELTQRLVRAGIERISGPRLTGDGYYESCMLDPDGNIVEITV